MAYVEKNGVPEPGWSDRVDSPEIAAAIAKNRKAAFKWGVVTCIIALVAPTVISKFAPDAVKPEHAIPMGLVIAGAIIVCSVLCKIVHSFRKPYEAVVTDSEMKATKNGLGMGINLTFEILSDGPAKGRKVFVWINYEHPKAEAQRIGREELASLCKAVGVPMPRAASEVMVGGL